METSAFIVLLGIITMLLILVLDKMRAGFTLFAGSIVFMVAGIITPEELIAGFSNKEMITVAMLFLIGEGVRQSGALNHIVRQILPRRRAKVGGLLLRLLPPVTALSMVLNNTAVVIIFAPIIKRWATKVGMSAKKFLLPLSYATIFGGVCTLIGTSTNMVVNGMMIDAGYRGFTMFEIGQVGGVIAIVGTLYLVIFGNMLLPNEEDGSRAALGEKEGYNTEIMLASRFPGMGRRIGKFNFERHYGGAKIVGLVRNGIRVTNDIDSYIFMAGDMLQLSTDSTFAHTWRDSSAFYIVSCEDDDKEDEKPILQRDHRMWLGISLLLFMIVGSTIGGTIDGYVEGVKIDIFLLAAVVMVAMAVTRLFPAKRYTKFITWDILIAIASAFAISRAMSNSGINDMIAEWILSVPQGYGAVGVLALLYLVTMILTEFITNNAAVAITFPVAMALSQRMGVDPMPLFVAICIAASASFSSPIGYQTNLIVQGVGGYRFRDYLRVGLWLNLITFIIAVLLIPRIWSF